MTESSVVLDWSGALPHAGRELTDDEIAERYGDLMEVAVSAFREDPEYIVSMAASAAALREKRRKRAATRKAS